MSTRRWITATLSTLVLMAWGALPAFAHVTVSTDNDSAGGFAKYTVRVPNEREDASTVEMRVQLADGLEASRVQPVAGWTIELTDGELLISGGTIAPGEFQEFSFQARNPEQPGQLAFPAVQVYDSGEEVEWVGEPGSDEPASVVEIATAGSEETPEEHGGAELADLRSQVETLETTVERTQEAQGASTGPDTLAVAALVVAALGLVSGGSALAVARRR